MSQSLLASVLAVRQAMVSMWEAGARPMPEGIDAELADLEQTVLDLTDRMVELAGEHAAEVLIVHATDESLWAAHPEMDGIPALLQRVAAARALVELRAEGHQVEIVQRPVTARG